MSINGALVSPQGDLVITVPEHPGQVPEAVLLHAVGVGADIVSGEGHPGAGENYHISKGQVYLTNLRIVFCAKPPGDFFKSFSVPLDKIRQLNYAQRIFRANAVEFVALPVPRGGAPVKVSLSFKDGGDYTFYERTNTAVQSFSSLFRQVDAPPPYAPPGYGAPPSSSSAPAYEPNSAYQPRPEKS